MDQIRRITEKNKKWLTPAILAILSITFALFFSRYFRWQVGVGYDSVIYLNAAKSLLIGNGFTQASVQITHYPPLYPASLALVSWISGRDIIASATLSVILLYGLNIFLAGLLIWRVTNSGLAGLGMGILIAVLPGFASMHFEAMSEPLFFAFLLLALIFLMEYIRSGKVLWAILAGISGGLSAMTRYIGVFVIATIALTILIFYQGSFKRRLAQAIITGLVGSLLLAGWLIRNQLVTGGLTNRTFIFHPQNLSYYLFAGKGFSDLLGPQYIKSGISGIPGFLFIISAILVFAVGVYFLIANRKIVKVSSNSRKFLVVCLFSIITYLFFLLFSVNFLMPPPD
jgi:4-amino-4-deoxy-L-arabinose transferase-like glycosyltransferase